MRWNICIAIAALVSGCVAAVDDTATSEVALDDGGCIGAGCPGNSDLYAALGIFELSVNPAERSVRGFSLDPSHIWKGTDPLSNFQVVGAEPRATHNGGLIAGSGLVGTKIRILHKSGQQYDLSIDGYMTTGYYTNPMPGNLLPFPAYEIRYRRVGENDRWNDLCPYVNPFGNGVQGTWAVFWKGDRIDPVTGIFSAHDAGVGDWFNISCAGEATIKMLRTGTGGAVDPSTAPLQRQATLDMFTARYCPGSERYTHLGQKIDWDDRTGSNTLPALASFEAIWDGNGAVCLDHPRIPGQTYDCEPPPCTGDMLHNWRDHGWLRSGRPLLLPMLAP